MVIDSHLILFEGSVVSGTGDVVGLTSLQIPAKAEPIPICVRFTENLAGASSVTLTLQQSDSETGTYTDIEGTELTVLAKDFIVGNRLGWRFLPRSVVLPWLRLDVQVEGTATAGKLFCAIAGYEDEPYELEQMLP